jgi:cupin fold WbuC family metalloprotein
MENNYIFESPEVMYAINNIERINKKNIEEFKQLSSKNQRKRIRLCAHHNKNELIHEMLIVHERGVYVRPHKHPEKSESTHIIEGVVDVVIFDDYGHIEDVIRMGDYASGNIFYYRMATPLYHTLIIRSDILVFHETTNGPFNKLDTVFPSWAPLGDNEQYVVDYMNKLTQEIKFKY